MEEPMMEGPVVEALMERRSGKPWRKRRMRETCAGETGAAEARATAPRADMHSASHAAHSASPAAVHAASEATAMHAAAEAAAVPAASHPTAVPAAATATATSECWWRKCKRRTERTGDETTKELVGHANSSCRIASMNTTATDAVARRRRPADPNGPAISNDKCDSF
jgi:hypothetical protein